MGLVQSQLDYYEEETKEHAHADEWLERGTNRCLGVALVLTALFLLSAAFQKAQFTGAGIPVIGSALAWLTLAGLASHDYLKALATVFGAGMPAIAAALSAIRNHGEYGQQVARYSGMVRQLEFYRRSLERLTDDSPPPHARLSRLSSAELASLARSITATLLEELHQWRAMLHTKDIERS